MEALLVMTLLVLALVAWNTAAWPTVRPRPEAAPPPDGDAVAVLVPARDEEANLPACLESVLAQGDAVRSVLVYDDHSNDGTAAVAEAFARRDARVRLVPPQPIPPDWYGKPFACARLAEAAAEPWVLFLDADARLEPGGVAGLVAAARARDATLLSGWPGLVLGSFWERLLMPLLNFVVFSLFPAPLSLRDKRPALGLAHGACLLAHRDVYAAVGGHGAVRTELFEDTALARHWRARGERGLCLDGRRVVRVRMYATLREIWLGFAKTFYPAFRREPSFWLFLAFHAALFVAPPVAALGAAAAGHAWAAAWAAWGAAAAMRLLQAARFGYPVWSALLHPAAETMLLALALWSRYRCAGGRGLAWKGRIYRGR